MNTASSGSGRIDDLRGHPQGGLRGETKLVKSENAKALVHPILGRYHGFSTTGLSLYEFERIIASLHPIRDSSYRAGALAKAGPLRTSPSPSSRKSLTRSIPSGRSRSLESGTQERRGEFRARVGWASCPPVSASRRNELSFLSSSMRPDSRPSRASAEHPDGPQNPGMSLDRLRERPKVP